MRQHCGSTMSLSACGHTTTITEPLSLYSQPLRRVTCVRTGNAEVGAFAFQRRCFVVAGRAVLMHESPLSANDPLGMATGGPLFGDWAEVSQAVAGISSGRHHKAPSPSGRAIDTANGPAWAAPIFTGSDDQSLQPIRRWCSDRSKVRASKGDRQRARPFDYAPHGTWSGIAQKRRLDGEGDSPYHPAEGIL